MAYCLDSSVLIESWVRLYPPDLFPSLWDKFDHMIDEGHLVASEEVLHEIEAKQDGLYRWVKTRSKLFLPTDEATQTVVKEILEKFPKLVDTMKNRNRADPFVIALARVTSSIVVTEEKNTGTPDRPRIPIVCEHYNIKCMNILGLIRQQGWTF